MNPTRPGRRSGVRPWSARSLAVGLTLALGLAGCAGSLASRRPANDVPVLQPFQIRDVQRTLGDRGLHVQPTGEWDEPTRSALARFQASKGLPSTGQLDWATVRELGVDLDPRHNCEMNNSVDCYPLGD